ncbi:hypothetical protein P280DRAFT_224411 [Massarina eburnea CBS 473.64]|uniref:Uncharacterized protein n=1 Tax=Massarina eburnea CBS 473.64 TaxID=1395130 RepID=A0A6A6SB62_9PLEO|nr:hypothetical protein P280DRAFT_224411 [Massarina eburnea CBS 473.64]
MDISAALTATEVALLSEPERACEDANRQLEKRDVNGNGTTAKPELEGLGNFEESLRLKNTLDTFEERARIEPLWKTLSVLINCEYRLFVLNESTPLRNNPFLSHWVEAIQRLEQPATERVAISDDGISTSHLNRMRVEFIKALLRACDSSQFAQKSPRQLCVAFDGSGKSSFDLRPYISMLEEEEIYERTPEPHESRNTSPKGNSPALPQEATATRPKLNDFQQWKQNLISRLQTEPEVAIPELTHLPIELSSLDFLTTLLQEGTLQSLAIDPAPVISDYIQHALRLTEKMGEPPSSSSPESSSVNGGSEQVIDHGREAQTRAVKLLLLFIRNLIRKALVGMEAIYFEIQEICVRYVWIKEVREFRTFIEGESDGGDRSFGG